VNLEIFVQEVMRNSDYLTWTLHILCRYWRPLLKIAVKVYFSRSLSVIYYTKWLR
jgi:hypothetical protein